MRHIYLYIAVVCCAVLSACSPSVPTGAVLSKTKAVICPDYDSITIPVNIAPMNFQIREKGDEYITHVHAEGAAGEGFTVSGQVVKMDEADWKTLLSANEGKRISIDTYVKRGGQWTQYPAITMEVAEAIDPYITYRLLEPSYVNFEVMSINQRCLENFDEEEIFNTCTFLNGNEGQCINCHTARNYNKDGLWQMHVRVGLGGTVIADGNNVKKVDLKTDQTISAGVYPSWHPTLPVIAYSNNRTAQIFHNTSRNKIEVQDDASDLILYDYEQNTVQIIANDSTEWETFPNWSPDGKTLYYVSATIPSANADSIGRLKFNHPEKIKYNIWKRSFDTKTRRFGEAEMIYDAAAAGASATFPRVSPDGRFLMFTQGEYGTFHIWHHDADLWLLDLNAPLSATGAKAMATGTKGGTTGAGAEATDAVATAQNPRPMKEINSEDTESYHNWSSNGRWVIFSTRRDDGNYTRLYIAYFGKDGKARKPFILPQRIPFYNLTLCKSYNIPEFIAEPVTTNRNNIIDAIANDPLKPSMVEK